MVDLKWAVVLFLALCTWTDNVHSRSIPDEIGCADTGSRCKGFIVNFAKGVVSSYEECAFRCREYNKKRRGNNMCNFFTFTPMWTMWSPTQNSTFADLTTECRFYRDCPEVVKCDGCKSGNKRCADDNM